EKKEKCGGLRGGPSEEDGRGRREIGVVRCYGGLEVDGEHKNGSGRLGFWLFTVVAVRGERRGAVAGGGIWNLHFTGGGDGERWEKGKKSFGRLRSNEILWVRSQ
ncbi:hypothetical protein HAX54_018759, partial [Datura stramonium]|nr:hypothetical protein [Datura stramonium]